jgi:hypothetical protein
LAHDRAVQPALPGVELEPEGARFDGSVAVHAQVDRGGPANRRLAMDLHAITYEAEDELVAPAVGPRNEGGDVLAGFRVAQDQSRKLGAVAGAARQGQGCRTRRRRRLRAAPGAQPRTAVEELLLRQAVLALAMARRATAAYCLGGTPAGPCCADCVDPADDFVAFYIGGAESLGQLGDQRSFLEPAATIEELGVRCAKVLLECFQPAHIQPAATQQMECRGSARRRKPAETASAMSARSPVSASSSSYGRKAASVSAKARGALACGIQNAEPARRIIEAT